MFTKTNSRDDVSEERGEMGSNHIFKMFDLGNCKNSVGLKPNAEWKKDAKAPSIPISRLSKNQMFISILIKYSLILMKSLCPLRAL